MYRLHIPCSHCNKVFVASVAKETSRVRCIHCHLASPFPGTAPDEKLWIVCKGKTKVGPFTHRHLCELATSRQLTPHDRICNQGCTDDIEAQSLQGLFTPICEDQAPKLVMDETVAPVLPSSPGTVVDQPQFHLALSDFQILQKLGAGGMGAVFLARQSSTDRTVALKILAEVLAGDAGFVQRFRREEEILATLDHPNIVQFIGAGRDRDVHFLVMEFIEGNSAASLVKHHGKFNVGDALFIVRQTADAMKYAFAHKVIHRDIKPENIMITRDGQVKIADLGLAKSLDALGADSDLTESGTGLGTPKYMAPEQAHDAKSVDQRSDIYALGGVFYFLLTAEAPFKGATSMELLLAKERKQFTPARRINPDVPARVDLMIDKMLAKDPKYRYQNYAELIRDIDNLGLTNPQLSFDASEAIATNHGLSPYEILQVLLIDSAPETASLAAQALAEKSIASNLVVVNDGAEARAYFRREGKFLLAPPPHLILFGTSMDPRDSLLTLEEIKVSDTLSVVPLVILAQSSEVANFFAAHGYQVSRVSDVPADVGQFTELFQSVRSLCLTVMEIKPDQN